MRVNSSSVDTTDVGRPRVAAFVRRVDKRQRHLFAMHAADYRT